MEDRRIKELMDSQRTGKILLGEIITKGQVDNQPAAVINFKGLKVFCPESELGVKDDVKDKVNALLGVPVEFVVIAESNGQFLVSRRKAMEQRRKQWANLKIGDIVNGRITGITPRNAFVEVYGYEFPLPVEEMLWNYTNDLRRHFKLGQRVKVKILATNPPRVSVKEAMPDPWSTPPEVQPEQTIAAPVDAIAPFGILVRLPDGKQCLCPPYTNARENPIIGTKVAVLIKTVDVENRRIFGTILRILR
ncbi:S1 RNA-binding domain-containing protein [Anaerocellum danielii]|uniref:S1 RNA-binding domain-containing protein n=1 Tax=Anaerocellum danielii TaxID=1387557 RepID=A0ABZ0TY95_9FIRM|nr:S1 RNA-binding domain-containing protein [Caldicellulosiruptor danielii]WPX08209.1 S1 RNA-binding domain-containing protein [Caldicellulosiruptor danielii]